MQLIGMNTCLTLSSSFNRAACVPLSAITTVLHPLVVESSLPALAGSRSHSPVFIHDSPATRHTAAHYVSKVSGTSTLRLHSGTSSTHGDEGDLSKARRLSLQLIRMSSPSTPPKNSASWYPLRRISSLIGSVCLCVRLIVILNVLILQIQFYPVVFCTAVGDLYR